MIDEGLPDAAEPTLSEVLRSEPGAAVIRLDDSETIVLLEVRSGETQYAHSHIKRAQLHLGVAGKTRQAGGIPDREGRTNMAMAAWLLYAALEWVACT